MCIRDSQAFISLHTLVKDFIINSADCMSEWYLHSSPTCNYKRVSMSTEFPNVLIQEPKPHTSREEHMRRRRSAHPFGNPRFTWDYDRSRPITSEALENYRCVPLSHSSQATCGLSDCDVSTWLRCDMSRFTDLVSETLPFRDDHAEENDSE